MTNSIGHFKQPSDLPHNPCLTLENPDVCAHAVQCRGKYQWIFKDRNEESTTTEDIKRTYSKQCSP